MNSINRLEKAKYLEGANLTLEHSKDLFNTAIKAGELKSFGIASSLLVLSIEELAKATALKIKSINNQIHIVKLDKYFRSHVWKQIFIFEAMAVLVDTEENKNEEKIDLKNPNSTTIIIIGAVIAIAVCAYVILKNGGNLKTNKSLLDDIKESGFYVGYDEGKREWKSPNQTNDEESYNNLRELTSKAFKLVEDSFFNKKMNASNIIDFVENLGENVIDKKQFEKLKKQVKKSTN